ncbi:hypothetical protein PR003_g3416 [Phytophthora rubi]|uniref:PiggyBac transposable element-derived protein domain-containing protein n=1 Tax=Phytophthora rubi TaxID=129364 RepID=A0A6A4G110_9STRA|nr:hypothetical protein PR001_g3234 [Phytophthora rubi]KAE9354305.1 hypothetical protein PR003_g3416 [Phytophthora rubi]
MAFMMDFKAEWPLLRKDGWTRKPATGLQIHANYLKPGRTLRGGKIGLDFFNGEDSLLAHVKADKELCARLNISNIMVRTQVGPSESSATNEPSRVVCVTHACNDTQTAPSHREESTEGEKGEHGQSCQKTAKKAPSKPKNKTKQQLATSSIRALAARDAPTVEAPTEPAAAVVVSVSNADQNGNADTDVPPKHDVEAYADSDSEDDSRNSDGSVSAYEDNQSDEEEEDSDEEHDSVQEGGIDGDRDTAADESVRQFAPAPAEFLSSTNASEFEVVDPSDPNLVLSDAEDRIESDGESSEDSVCVQDESDDEDETSEDIPNDAVGDEATRVAKLLSDAELDGLHMRVEGSSAIFDDEQLSAMAVDGWTVFPENEITTIVDDPEVDKMYEGYCGPSQDVLKAANSPLSLFFYFLPKAFWRHVALETHRYWQQTFEARLASAVVKESGITHRPRKSSDKLRRRL